MGKEIEGVKLSERGCQNKREGVSLSHPVT